MCWRTEYTYWCGHMRTDHEELCSSLCANRMRKRVKLDADDNSCPDCGEQAMEAKSRKKEQCREQAMGTENMGCKKEQEDTEMGEPEPIKKKFVRRRVRKGGAYKR